MSNLLPFLISPQNSSNVSGGGIATESSASVKNNQPTVLQQTDSPAFAQVLRELHDRPSLLEYLNPSAPINAQANDVPLSYLTQKELESLEEEIGPDSLGNFLHQSQLYGLSTQGPQELVPQSPNGQDGVPDLLRLQPDTVYDGTIAEDQNHRIQPTSQHGTIPISTHTPLDESHVLANVLVQRHTFQSIDRGQASGLVSQSGPANRLVSEPGVVVPQTAVSKAPEVGASSTHGTQGPEGKLSTLLPNQDGEQGVRTLAPVGKDTSVALQQTNRVLQQTEPLKFLNRPSQTTSTIDPHHVRKNNVPLALSVPSAGPAGFTQTDSINQLLGKAIPGNVSTVNDLSSSVIENRTTLQIDPLGDTGLLNKGDRSQSVIDPSTKIVGLDASGGQGLGSGMNYPQNSQAGYQQSSSLAAQGMGVRGLTERLAEFPAPALQRLQMDVQLSETQRVSIDVGVQNRQVYAGLVTDHAVLRNLATQFVPQLENQLADVDMELQEFSAEVREERQQQDDSVFRHPSLSGQGARQASSKESVAPQSSVNQHEGASLHLVA